MSTLTKQKGRGFFLEGGDFLKTGLFSSVVGSAVETQDFASFFAPQEFLNGV